MRRLKRFLKNNESSSRGTWEHGSIDLKTTLKLEYEYMTANLFLANWSDLNASESQTYIDYETLINSDDEFLCLSSLDLDTEWLDDDL